MKILLAYDGFDYSFNALEEAARLAQEDDAEITIVSVVPQAQARASKAGGHRWLAPHAHQDVARAHAFLFERGIDAEMKILHGDPATELIREAAEGDYDLVVAGSRGLGPFSARLLGSVTRKLVKAVPCPVVVAGPEKTERHEPLLVAAR